MSKKSPKKRLDEELVSRGLFSSVDEADRAIMAGLVSGKGERFTSAATPVKAEDYLHVKDSAKYVSRGGEKLEGAFQAWSEEGFSAKGKKCVDIGCSTGGFTDCLLREGAASVAAVDVGYAQFDWGLRGDARVALFEKTNVRDFAERPENAGAFEFATVDVSFTSIESIRRAICVLLAPGATLLCLVKPQFELSREKISEGGIVTNEEYQKEAIEQVKAALEEEGFVIMGLAKSPIKGTKGNQEYLLWAERA